MVKAKHHEIKLHANSQLGSSEIECFFCRNKNVFMLGLCPLSQGDEKDVILCCRRFFCIPSETISDYDLRTEDWKAIINEKQVIQCIVSEPSHSQIKRSREINVDVINSLEALRKTNPDAKIEDLEQNKLNTPLPSVKLSYKDARDYMETFRQ